MCWSTMWPTWHTAVLASSPTTLSRCSMVTKSALKSAEVGFSAICLSVFSNLSIWVSVFLCLSTDWAVSALCHRVVCQSQSASLWLSQCCGSVLVSLFKAIPALCAETYNNRDCLNGNSYWRNIWSECTEWCPLNVYLQSSNIELFYGEDAVLC